MQSFPKPGPRKKRAKPKRPPSKESIADKLFSDLVRSRRICENGCGRRDGLDCGHAFSRRYRSTRWTLGFAICRICHSYFTQHPAKWTAWLKARWGEALYDEYYRLAQTGRVDDMDAIITALTADTQKYRGS